MDTVQLDKLREALLERKQELESEIAEFQQEIVDLGDDQEQERGTGGNHFADDASSLGEQETISTIGDDFKEQLQMVEAALKRMDEGTYGVCQRCGKAIPVERLEALPYAAYCIECKAHLERQHALYGSVTPPAP